MPTLREQYAELEAERERQRRAAELRVEIQAVARQVDRVARKYQSAAERKGSASWDRVLKACGYLLELQELDRQLTGLRGVKGLPFAAARRLLPQLIADAHAILLRDPDARSIAGHVAGDAYKMASVILRVARPPTKTRRRTSGKAKSARKGDRKQTLPVSPARVRRPAKRRRTAEARAMLGD